jgi:hypothetical protein
LRAVRRSGRLSRIEGQGRFRAHSASQRVLAGITRRSTPTAATASDEPSSQKERYPHFTTRPLTPIVRPATRALLSIAMQIPKYEYVNSGRRVHASSSAVSRVGRRAPCLLSSPCAAVHTGHREATRSAEPLERRSRRSASSRSMTAAGHLPDLAAGIPAHEHLGARCPRHRTEGSRRRRRSPAGDRARSAPRCAGRSPPRTARVASSVRGVAAFRRAARSVAARRMERDLTHPRPARPLLREYYCHSKGPALTRVLIRIA